MSAKSSTDPCLLLSAFAFLSFLAFLNSAQATALVGEVFVFGDSLSDTGRLREATVNLPPPLQFAPSPPYFEGRFSNGPTWVDYLQQRYPAASITNYAVAGAMTGNIGQALNLNTGLPDDVDNYNEVILGAVLSPTGDPVTFNGVIGLGVQIADFSGTTNRDAKFVVWSGGNDFFAGRNPLDVAADTEQVIRELLAKGATNLFVANLPDLGSIPLAGLLGLRTEFSLLTLAYNSLLETTLMKLGTEFPDLHFELVDMYLATNQLMDNAAAAGITDIVNPCIPDVPYVETNMICSDPSQFFFYDLVHPTTKVHAGIGETFASSLTGVPEPGVLLLLCNGLFFIGMGRLRSMLRR